MTTATAIVWFRQDLRLEDNPALQAAVQKKTHIVPVYIWAPEEEERWPAGAASKWWLHQSLNSLDQELRRLHSRLIVRAGKSLDQLTQLIDESSATMVLWNRRYEPAAIERDGIIAAELRLSKYHRGDFQLGRSCLSPGR